MSSPNAGQVEVFAGLTVAATMVQGLISPSGVSDVKGDIGKPGNTLRKYPDVEVQTGF